METEAWCISEAYRLYYEGFRPSYSTSISGYVTAGYGQLDFCGEFQFPLEVDQETFVILSFDIISKM